MKTGKVSSKTFSRVYTLIPGKIEPVLRDSGLANANGLLNVNHSTLQHNVYPNIFGVGDCTDLPTSKNYAACVAQADVVRHNVMRYRDGKELDAIYDGYARAPLMLSNNHMTHVEHTYGG